MDVGGLENGLVQLINRLPADRFRHAIICMTDYTDFIKRIQRDDVPVCALHKKAGKDPHVYLRLWRLLRDLRPDITHSRNLATLEAALVAALAAVPYRIHGEHGRDVHDLHLRNAKYRWMRRLLRPFVHRFVTLSGELSDYLVSQVRVPEAKVCQIYNGVDSERFTPSPSGRAPLPPPGFAPPGTCVIGTVGRLARVKDQLNLARAFLDLLRQVPEARRRLRLVMVGEGSLLGQIKSLLSAGQAEDLAWLPGNRDDVPQLLRGLDVFVLPSLAEGMSNGILEAMATGLPVVATRVGGNPELVSDGESGFLVPPGDSRALAEAIGRYVREPELAREHGAAARRRVETEFSVAQMVDRYAALYAAVTHGGRRGNEPPA
jgi:sugar transferase (PEP-CTERM/EpsH1 system associated)